MSVRKPTGLFASSLLGLLMVISAAAQGQERVELDDGSVLNVFVVEPSGNQQEPSPLVILMGGGPGNVSISQDTSRWLGSGFAERGWLVAVPVSPNNSSFRGEANIEKIEELIAKLKTRAGVSQGKVLLAGVSNGGMSALEIAARDPGSYLGVAAVPALYSPKTDKNALQGFKVYLRIGGSDQLGWADRFDATVASLTEAGAQLDAEVLDGAPHMFRMDWSTLGPWLESL